MSKFWSTGDSSSSGEDMEGEDDSISWSQDQNEDSVSSNEELSEDPNTAWRRIKDDQVFRDPLQSTTVKPPNCTRIVCMSDTHGKHRDVHLPAGDILLHGGDFTKSGEVGSIQDLSNYFDDSGFEEVICIAGNHDMTLHPEYYEKNWVRFHHSRFDCNVAQDFLKHCIYLKDSSHTTKHGIEVHGSPWSPEFFDWAFNLPRGAPIREIWDKIPLATDVLITHGPPLGRGDLTPHKGRAGCYDLLVAVQERIKPRVHVFGHIHEGAGVTFDGQVLYINASNLNITYQAVNHPVVIDIPHDRSKPGRVVPPNCQITSKGLPGWCKNNGYGRIGLLLDDCDLDALPSGNALLGEDAYEVIVEQIKLHRGRAGIGYRELRIKLHRDRAGYPELRSVLSALYAQSFPK